MLIRLNQHFQEAINCTHLFQRCSLGDACSHSWSFLQSDLLSGAGRKYSGHELQHFRWRCHVQGTISLETLTVLERARAAGHLLVIVTGARYSTLMLRLPALPAADAYICENGGRIFYPGSVLPLAMPLREDSGWRAMQEFASMQLPLNGLLDSLLVIPWLLVCVIEIWLAPGFSILPRMNRSRDFLLLFLGYWSLRPLKPSNSDPCYSKIQNFTCPLSPA